MHQPRMLRHKTPQRGAIEGPIGTLCPNCAKPAWFDIQFAKSDVHGEPRRCPCPGCGTVVWFYVVGVPGSQGAWLWIDPDPKEQVVFREDVAAALGERNAYLREAYEEAFANHSDGRWSSAVVQARRTLEGVVRDLLGSPPEERRMLGALLKDLAEEDGLADPLLATAEVVKDGGNIGGHLDYQRPADERLSTDALLLLDSIVQYLLVLPVRVELLRAHIDGTAADDVAEGAGDEASSS